MKKVSFLSISFISILTGLFLLFGCNNGTKPSKNNSNNVDNNKKSYLSVSGVTVSGEKTAVPVFTNDTISDFVFTLKGKTADSDTEETLGTYEGLEALTSASIPVETGNWTFTLTAAKDGTAFTGTREMEIITGSNTISFALKWDEEALSGEGNLTYTFDFSKAATKNDVELVTGELVKYNPTSKEETAVEEYKESPLDVANSKVTYVLTEVPADVYRIRIRLYGDIEKTLPILTYPELAIITGGQTSTATRETKSLNAVYSISFFEDSTTEITDSSYPSKYTTLSEPITLPASYTKSGYEFKGWYTNPSFEGDAVTRIAKGNTGNKAFYAKLVPEGGFVYVPGATVTGSVGSGDSVSQIFIEGRTVPIGDLYVCDHEVTQKEYEEFMTYYGAATTGDATGQGGNSEPYKPNDNVGDGDDFPAYYVSWYEAIVYCNLRSAAEGLTPAYYLADANGNELKLGIDQNGRNVADWGNNIETDTNGKYFYNSIEYYNDNLDYLDQGSGDSLGGIRLDLSANGYRLPTEAEWEYLARGGVNGTQYTYSGSDTLENVGWYGSNSGDNGGSENPKVHEIRTKAMNAFGLYDMSGNVFERCWDWGRRTTSITPDTPSTGDSLFRNKIARGGSWAQEEIHSTVYYRNNESPNRRFSNLGFRVVRNASDYPLIVKFDTTTNWPGNTQTITHQIINAGEKATLPSITNPAPTVDDAKRGNFLGWYTKSKPAQNLVTPTDATSSAIDSPFDFDTPIDTGITLYAVWDFVYVPGTTFDGSATIATTANSADQSVVFTAGRTLTIDDLWASDHEVTQAEYEAYCTYGRTAPKDNTENIAYGPDKPAYFIGFYDTLVYCNLRSKAEGLNPVYSLNGETDPTKWSGIQSADVDGVTKYYGPTPTGSKPTDALWDTIKCNWTANGYRLPTEAEWEYLARGGLTGTQYTYAGSDTIDNVAWYRNSDNALHDVKTKTANTFGLYDMSGSVFEWCWDWYGGDTISADTSVIGPTEALSVTQGDVTYLRHICRGGSFGQNTGYCTVFKHHCCGTNARDHDVGFRVVRNYGEGTPHYIVRFDVTTNWADNTANLASVVVDGDGKTITAPDYDDAKTGYSFMGWYTKADPDETDSPFDFTTVITDDIKLYAVWKKIDVGSLLLTNGTFVFPNDITSANVGDIVGIVYDLEENGEPKGVLGIKNSGNTKYKWTSSASSPSIASIPSIICTQSSTGDDGTASSATFEGDTDGSDNWNEICETDNSANDNSEENYPAFYFANNYGTVTATNLSGTNYEDGWYIPSVSELCQISRKMDVLNSVLESINAISSGAANKLSSTLYWSASQDGSISSSALSVSLSVGSIHSFAKTCTECVCCVRVAKPLTDYTVKFNTNGGSAVTLQKVEKGQKASAPQSPTRGNLEFAGWYTSTDGGTTLSETAFDFDSTPITDYITLYAKWQAKEGFAFVEGMTVNSTNASSLAILKSRELTINDFCMGDHEVTQKEWANVMGALPVGITDEITDEKPQGQGIGDDYPVYYVTWYATIVYCNKLSINEGLDCAYSVSGKDESYWQNFNYPDDLASITTTDCDTVNLDMTANGYRLPTEVEWEYAARGGKNLESYTFAGSNDYTTVAWARENSDLTTHPVKTDKTEGVDSANSLGLYDMCGNVNEWVWDYFNSSSTAIGTNTPITGATSGSDSKRVKKGGGWDSVAESGDTATIDKHSGTDPTEGGSQSSDHMNIGFGFRVVQTATTNP